MRSKRWCALRRDEGFPSATTTCELNSTNEYGRSVAKVKVTVH